MQGLHPRLRCSAAWTSFGAHRGDRFEPRRARGGVDTEDDARSRAKGKRESHRPGCDRRGQGGVRANELGEAAFGTNYGIQRFTGEMLFDEKIGGTIQNVWKLTSIG